MKTVQKIILILFLVSFALSFASCEKTRAPAYYYPALDRESAQGDIGNNY